MSEGGGSEDESEWMGDTEDEEDELDSGREGGLQGLGNDDDSDSDSDSDSDDEDDEDDVVVDDDDDDKDKDEVLTDDTSLSGTTLVNDDSDWMDEDTDDDVEIILGDLDTDEEMEDGEVGEEWFGNAGP